MEQPQQPKLCSCGCGLPRDRPGQRYRQDCHNRYMRERRRNGVEAFLTRAETHLCIIALQKFGTPSAMELATRLEQRLL